MMKTKETLTRRSFLALAGAALPLAGAVASTAVAQSRRRVPVGLELFSVREQLKVDLPGTLRAVSKMGYEGVEFFSPYFDWTPAYAKEVRKMLDDLRLRCFSTHNGRRSFVPENIARAVELNQTLGSRYVIMAGAGRVENLDGWKAVAEDLNRAAEKMKPEGLRVGFHNHQTEFKPLEGRRPIELLAAETGREVVLQLDVGTCLEAGGNPVAWIKANPGRIDSIHCKEWSPDPAKGYRVLFGEGIAPWPQIFEAAERVGGVKYYLIEQEGSAYPEIETAERCLAAYRQLRASTRGTRRQR